MPLAERRELAPAAAPGRAQSSCATKLTLAIRSTSSAAVWGCAQAKARASPPPKAARGSDELAPALAVLVGRVCRGTASAARSAPACSRSESSRRFQTSAIVPPGRSTRAISASAGSGSNQWKACPAATASTLASLERQRLGRAGDDLCGGRDPGEHRPHLGERLDRDHPRTGLEQRPRQLAGAGPDVDDRAPRPESEPAPQERDRVRRIAGPRPLVQLGHGAKRVGRRMDLPAGLRYEGVTR